MLSLTYVRPHVLEWRDVPEPAVRDDRDALVRPLAMSICDIDRPVIAGRSPFPPPFAIGHEAVAEVIAVGDAVRTVVPGRRVVVPWHIACGECARCRRGLTAHCESGAPQAMYGLPSGGHWGGLFDEIVRVPYADQMLVAVPDGLDPVDVVSAGDNLTLGLEIMGPHLRANPDWRVLVLGSGVVGLHQVQVARVISSAPVVYVDIDDDRLALAAGLGAATATGPPSYELGKFDLIVDVSFDPAWLRRATRMLEPEGVLECLGGYFEDVRLPLLAMYSNGVRFRIGRSNTRPHIEPTLDLVSSGALDPGVLRSEVLTCEHAPQALAQPTLKPVVVRDPTA
jgi:threonine dehydrogenase-like Zn-dependent dehydrogenase